MRTAMQFNRVPNGPVAHGAEIRLVHFAPIFWGILAFEREGIFVKAT